MAAVTSDGKVHVFDLAENKVRTKSSQELYRLTQDSGGIYFRFVRSCGINRTKGRGRRDREIYECVRRWIKKGHKDDGQIRLVPNAICSNEPTGREMETLRNFG